MLKSESDKDEKVRNLYATKRGQQDVRPEQWGKFHPSEKCYGIFSVTELTGCRWVTSRLVTLHLLADNVAFYLGIFLYP